MSWAKEISLFMCDIAYEGGGVSLGKSNYL